jgi:hypothetical protein
MYPNPIPISDGSATVNFDLNGTQLNESLYKNASADLDKPHTIAIKHSVSNVGKPTQVRRSVVRVDQVVEDASGTQGTLSVYVVAVVPEKVATTAQLTAGLTLMKSFLSASGYIGKVVAAEI